MRSPLLLPPDPETFAAGRASGADALVVDLAGAGDPPTARAGARACLALARSVPVWVKVHRLAGDGLCAADLEALVEARPDAILLPGATGPADVLRLSAMLAAREALAGIADGATRIVAVAADTPGGVLALGGYGGSSARLSGLAFDAAALAAALAIDPGAGGPAGPVATARALLAIAAAAAGVPAIDGPSPGGADDAALAADIKAARAAGYRAKLALAPAQVPAINRAFPGG